MQINPDLTLREVQARLDKAGLRLHVNYEHGVYHAYVHGDSSVRSYDRGNLAEAIDGATRGA